MKLINWLLIKWQLLKDFFHRMVYGHSILKTVKVTPNVYLGGAFNKNKIAQIKKWGITAVISLRQKLPPGGINTLHIPTKDRHAPTIKELEQGIDFIKKEIANGGKVYIHCRSGVGRGPTMLIAYLISTGYELKKAIKLIKQVRNFISLTAVQMDRLIEFEKHISK